jgi:AmmeMemoRadiSam system protein A
MSSPSDAAGQQRHTSVLAEFSREDRHTLLRIAHESILGFFSKQSLPQAPSSPQLLEPRGIFTTLYLGGELRGCVGYAIPVSPLYRAVADTARAAAFEDSRFQPVRRSEAEELRISLSVLSLLVRVEAAQIAIGRHGLVVSLGEHRGLLLPQVPVEHGWDRETFLAQTCRKAGLPFDAWRNGAILEVFTAEIFGDAQV